MFTICPLLYIFLKSWTKNPGATALCPPDVHTSKARKKTEGGATPPLAH